MRAAQGAQGDILGRPRAPRAIFWAAQGAPGDNPGRKKPPAGDIPGGRAVFDRQFPKFPEPDDCAK